MYSMPDYGAKSPTPNPRASRRASVSGNSGSLFERMGVKKNKGGDADKKKESGRPMRRASLGGAGNGVVLAPMIDFSKLQQAPVDREEEDAAPTEADEVNEVSSMDTAKNGVAPEMTAEPVPFVIQAISSDTSAFTSTGKQNTGSDGEEYQMTMTEHRPILHRSSSTGDKEMVGLDSRVQEPRKYGANIPLRRASTTLGDRRSVAHLVSPGRLTNRSMLSTYCSKSDGDEDDEDESMRMSSTDHGLPVFPKKPKGRIRRSKSDLGASNSELPPGMDSFSSKGSVSKAGKRADSRARRKSVMDMSLGSRQRVRSTGRLDAMMDSSNRNSGTRIARSDSRSSKRGGMETSSGHTAGTRSHLNAVWADRPNLASRRHNMEQREVSKKLGVSRTSSHSSQPNQKSMDSSSDHNPHDHSHSHARSRASMTRTGSDSDLRDCSGCGDDHGLKECNTQGFRPIELQRKGSDKQQRQPNPTSQTVAPPEGVTLRKAGSSTRLAGLSPAPGERKIRTKSRSPSSKDVSQASPRRSSKKSVGSSGSSGRKEKVPRTPKRKSGKTKVSAPSETGSDSFNNMPDINDQDTTTNPAPTPPVRRHNPSETWVCKCGYELRLIMKFCGMCASPQNWTCSSCGFDENLCAFRFCGGCAAPKSARSGSSNSGNEKMKAVKTVSPNSVVMVDLDTSESTLE